MPKRKGQSLVEFALVLLPLSLLLMGVIDFGWLVFNYVQLNNGLREALRYGSVPSFSGVDQYRNCSGIYDVLKKNIQFAQLSADDVVVYYDNGYSAGPTDGANVVGTCTQPGPYTGTLSNGQRVVVQISTRVKFIEPFMEGWFPYGIQFFFRTARTIYPSAISQ